MSQNMKKANSSKSDHSDYSVIKTINSPIAARDLLKALKGQGFFKAELGDTGVLVPDDQYDKAERVLMRLEGGEALEPLYDQDGKYIENPEVRRGEAHLAPEYRGADLSWTAAEGCLHDTVAVKDSKAAIAEGFKELRARIEADAKARPQAYEGLTWADVFVRRRNAGDEVLETVDLVHILTGGKRRAPGSLEGDAGVAAKCISPDMIDDRLERTGDTVALDGDGDLLAPTSERGGVYDFQPDFVEAHPELLEISRGDGDEWFVDALERKMPSDAQIRALSRIMVDGRFDDPEEVDVYVGVPGKTLKLRKFDEKGIADAFRRLLGDSGKAKKAKPSGGSGSGSGSGSPEEAPKEGKRPPLTARETLIALSGIHRGDWDKIYGDIKARNHLDRGKADEAIASLKPLGLTATTLIDPDYPAALKRCSRPPFVVYSDDGGKALRALAREKNPCVVYLPAIFPEGGLGDYGQAAELRSSPAGELELYVRSTRDKALISTRPGGVPSIRGAHRLAVQLASQGGVIAVPESPYGEANLDAFLSKALSEAAPGMAPEIVARVTAGRSWNNMALRNGLARIWIDQSDVKDAILRATGQNCEPDASWDGDGE